ncbi:uncharacterized protein DUF3565 [Panacagrimonas perspica]|uniref:Uncharacterized protein DUF3565 n=1 Tax=Panacagrimonas perspica TaxID=381431 RepID=A0A4R7PCI2_9GAMM|nr:DUF3565 domain-containing protein [Panacagrimonas perspica]TDU31835.1 uncharacterized protein DUF3565 [Panacagrimonas perspica]THD03324.1 GNAT family acetyltransferase [Panacagrimonas perspica]
MRRKIVGFDEDDHGDWVARLACGHQQHVRHRPPWINRPWVETVEGRSAALNEELECRSCDTQVPPDSAAP